jgi:hypothetical protein
MLTKEDWKDLAQTEAEKMTMLSPEFLVKLLVAESPMR